LESLDLDLSVPNSSHRCSQAPAGWPSLAESAAGERLLPRPSRPARTGAKAGDPEAARQRPRAGETRARTSGQAKSWLTSTPMCSDGISMCRPASRALRVLAAPRVGADVQLLPTYIDDPELRHAMLRVQLGLDVGVEAQRGVAHFMTRSTSAAIGWLPAYRSARGRSTATSG